MTMSKIEMLVRMVKIYGFEHPVTVQYAELLENPRYTHKDLETILKCHELYPVYMDEDDD